MSVAAFDLALDRIAAAAGELTDDEAEAIVRETAELDHIAADSQADRSWTGPPFD